MQMAPRSDINNVLKQYPTRLTHPLVAMQSTLANEIVACEL